MKAKLSDVITIISGGTPKTNKTEYWNGNINWLSIVDFGDVNKYVYNSEKKITELGLSNSSTQILNKNDIIISARGTVGTIAMLDVPMAFNQSCFGLRAKSECLIQDYLFYYLKNYMHNIKNKTQGSVFETINLLTFEMMEIEYPTLKKQEKISKSLSDIDYKIENNIQLNNNLEELMKTIYQRWFIEFEFPNEEGKPYKSSGGKIVWNEELKQEIPENWRIENCYNTSLYEIIKPGVENFELKNYLATGNVNENSISDGEWIKYDNRESRANMQPLSNSIWFAKMKNSVKHITLPKESDWFNKKYILSTGFLGIKCKEYALSYIHCFIYSDYFEKIKDMLAHGATQEAINNEDLKAIKLLVPEIRILKSFEDYTKGIIQSQLDNIKEIQELNSLKNYLLPLLMNGQINVDDIEI